MVSDMAASRRRYESVSHQRLRGGVVVSDTGGFARDVAVADTGGFVRTLRCQPPTALCGAIDNRTCRASFSAQSAI
ncbi:MAG: hypothetical protein LBK25_02755 [Treponema sp.]|nr:hypothetical protein [Treponema sp.]